MHPSDDCRETMCFNVAALVAAFAADIHIGGNHVNLPAIKARRAGPDVFR